MIFFITFFFIKNKFIKGNILFTGLTKKKYINKNECLCMKIIIPHVKKNYIFFCYFQC